VENCDMGIYFDSDSIVYGNEVCESDWAFIDYSSSSDVQYNYAHDNYCGFYSTSSSDFLKNQVIDNDYGIVVGSGSPKINYNYFIGNAKFGVENEGTTPVDAMYNFWGHSTGPDHKTYWKYLGLDYGPNYGFGDPVSDYVLYDDWLLGQHEIIIDVTPSSLNLESKGNYMNLKISSVPEGYSMYDIAGDTVMMIETIPLESYDVTGQSFSAKFDRAEFEDQIRPGDVAVLITGQFNDGTWFYGHVIINAHQ
jgi:hypothetical protein